MSINAGADAGRGSKTKGVKGDGSVMRKVKNAADGVLGPIAFSILKRLFRFALTRAPLLI